MEAEIIRSFLNQRRKTGTVENCLFIEKVVFFGEVLQSSCVDRAEQISLRSSGLRKGLCFALLDSRMSD